MPSGFVWVYSTAVLATASTAFALDVTGTAGNDRIRGSNGADTIDADAGDDRVLGGRRRQRDLWALARGDVSTPGVDTVHGEVGDDRIHTRDGEADVVNCGAGDDVALLDTADVNEDATAENPNGSYEKVVRAEPKPKPVDESISSVILLIGLAVGVDYSMFYLRREREERAAGRGEGAALAAAAATSGRAVLISGLTVMVMAGMYLAGNAVFTSFATGTILVVGVAMLGSVTVLPALLSKLGDRVNKGRVPFVARLRERSGGESRLWNAILDRVLKRPWLSVTTAAAVLIVIALPALKLHTVNPGVQGLPRDLAVMRTYDRIQAAFPGGNLPAVAVVRARDVTAPAVKAGIADLKRASLASGQMGEPIDVEVNPARNVALVSNSAAGRGHRQEVGSGPHDAARPGHPRDARSGARRAHRRHRLHGRFARFHRSAQGVPALRVRVRPVTRVPPAAGHVPFHRGPQKRRSCSTSCQSAPPTAS